MLTADELYQLGTVKYNVLVILQRTRDREDTPPPLGELSYVRQLEQQALDENLADAVKPHLDA